MKDTNNTLSLLKTKNINIYNQDSLEAISTLPDNYYDIAVIDPPYGINITSSGRLKRYNQDNKSWDSQTPPPEFFEHLFRVSRNQIIWGGNYFQLPPTRCFLIWDKEQPEGVSFASCEYAWTSLNHSAKTFYMRPQGIDKATGGRIHPTQKPVELYKWIFSKFVNPTDKVLDTHLGSMSSVIAAYQLGIQLDGYEIDPQHFEKAVNRVGTYINNDIQQNLFV